MDEKSTKLCYLSLIHLHDANAHVQKLQRTCMCVHLWPDLFENFWLRHWVYTLLHMHTCFVIIEQLLIAPCASYLVNGPQKLVCAQATCDGNDVTHHLYEIY